MAYAMPYRVQFVGFKSQCTHFFKDNDAAPFSTVTMKVICKYGMRVAVTVMFNGCWLMCATFSGCMHIIEMRHGVS